MSGFEIAELILLPLMLTAMLALPVIAAIKKKKSGKSMRRAMITNLCGFAAVMLCAIILPLGGFVSAAETTEAAASAAVPGQKSEGQVQGWTVGKASAAIYILVKSV